jgi:PKD repeat protein
LSTAFNGLSLTPGTTYYVSVKPVNNAGLEGEPTSSNGITIASTTLAGFFINTNEICQGDSIQYMNNSIGAVSYLWEFDGGIPSTSTNTNPIVHYPNSGVYDITLHAYGLADTATFHSQAAITVRPNPMANFDVSNTTLFAPDAMALFTNTSVNAVSYMWDFGDGSTSNDVNPWHLYGDTGVYSVQLIATSGYCGNDTLLKESYISVGFPSGIDDISENHLIISPNPANEFFEIIRTANNLEKATVYLINMEGQLILSEIMEAGQQKIKVSTKGISNGMYQVLVVTANNISRNPIVIK